MWAVTLLFSDQFLELEMQHGVGVDIEEGDIDSIWETWKLFRSSCEARDILVFTFGKNKLPHELSRGMFFSSLWVGCQGNIIITPSRYLKSFGLRMCLSVLFCFFFFNLFLAVLGLHCCLRFSLDVTNSGYPVVGFWLWRLLLLQSTGSRMLRLQ